MAPRKGTATAAVKTESKDVSVEAPAVEAGVEAETFTWKPKDGESPSIVLPSASAAAPKGKQFKFFYELNKRRNDLIAQIMYIMEAAEVGFLVQDQVFALDDAEIMELVNAWTAAVTGASVGES